MGLRQELFAPCLGLGILGLACSGELGGASAVVEEASPGTMNSGPPTRDGAREDTAEPTDWFSAVEAADCSAAAAPSRTRIRRLSPVQWNNLVNQVFGASAEEFPADPASSRTGFNTDAEANKVSALLAEAYFDAGERVATQAVSAVLAEFPCLSSAPTEPTCQSDWVAAYGARLFRRPLVPSEVEQYRAFFATELSLDPLETAVATTLRGLLLSPNAVYLTELGVSQPGSVELRPFERASLLSFTIADVPPDAPLWAAAEQGALTDEASLLPHAERLLALPQVRAKYEDFWSQYLGASEVLHADNVDANLREAVHAEGRDTFSQLVWQDQATFSDLLTSTHSYGDASLLDIYGDASEQAAGRLELPATERSGFVTQPGFLFSAEGASVESKVIHRGLLLRERLLCQPPTPPPPGLVAEPADLRPAGEGATPRESWDAFAVGSPACAACHQAFQPLGLAFEVYDDLGRYRSTYDDGRPILTAGELDNAGDATGPYTGVPDLVGRIAQSRIGELCFAKQFGQYALGRRLHAVLDACTIRSLSRDAGGGPISDFVARLSRLEAVSPREHY